MRLIPYILRRIANGLLVMAGVVLIVFFLFNVLPVNSARLTMGQRSDISSVEAVEKEFRLNLPWHQRLLLYFNDLSPFSFHRLEDSDSPSYLKKEEVTYKKIISINEVSLVLKSPNLGKSIQTRKRVSEVLSEKMYPTFILALSAMLLATVAGLILGVLAAIRQYSVWDNSILFFSTLGISQPAYFSGIIIAMVFGYYLSDYTHLHVRGSLADLDYDGHEITLWKNLWLPMVALGIRPVALITQLTRSSMLDVMNQDYIRTARAKGLGYYSIVFKHGLRNALNPVVTSVSGWLAALFTGAFFVEKVFDYKGLGLQTIESLLAFDFPVVMGAVLFVALVFVVMNILTDILYSILDPRVRVE